MEGIINFAPPRLIEDFSRGTSILFSKLELPIKSVNEFQSLYRSIMEFAIPIVKIIELSDRLDIKIEDQKSLALLWRLPEHSRLSIFKMLDAAPKLLSGRGYQISLSVFEDREDPEWRMIQIKVRLRDASTRDMIDTIKKLARMLPKDVSDKVLISCIPWD
ncbi:MAG: hypothetical protein ACP5K1_01175 [Candidatus Bathyarchaeia archaeon]